MSLTNVLQRLSQLFQQTLRHIICHLQLLDELQLQHLNLQHSLLHQLDKLLYQQTQLLRAALKLMETLLSDQG